MRSIDRVRPGVATLTTLLLALVWCTAAGASVGLDPMLAVEVAAAGLLAIWTALLAHDLLLAFRLRRCLDQTSVPDEVDGVALRVIEGGPVEAFVLGILRPTVYVGAASFGVLDAEELRAVVHHEDHHRRTRAPLRAAAVEAWLRIVGRWSAARRLLWMRLAELESAADAHAMRRGVRPAAIAAALLKVEATTRAGVSFIGTADHRITALLDAAAGRPRRRSTPLPYEWLPLVIAVAVTVGCHLGEVSVSI